MPPPPSLETALLGFFHRLRDARVPVSMVEVLDAFECLPHVDLADRGQLRTALQATLVKRAEDRDAFAVLFDVCFPLTPAPGGGNGHLGAGPGPDAPPRAPAPDLAAEPSGALLQALLGALRRGDEAAMRALAGLAVDRFGGMAAHPDATERYFLYRIVRQLELYRLARLALAGGLDARLERERLEQQIEDFRRMLAEQVRQRLATRGPERAAELYRERALEDVDFLGASTTQLAELRRVVRPLARKLAARLAHKRRRRRRGRLDVRRTVRRSLQYGGVLADPAFRARRATRPDLFVLADVSGSVVEFAEFTLSLLHAMRQELGRLRAFAFVDGIDEVSGLLEDADHRLDLRSTFARAEVVADDGHSHYGRVLDRFADRWGGEIDGRGTVIVMGDARGNYRDPGLATLRRIRERARRLYWLNPEPRAEWDTTDSLMGAYAEHCDRVFEVRNLRQLSDCVLEIG